MDILLSGLISIARAGTALLILFLKLKTLSLALLMVSLTASMMTLMTIAISERPRRMYIKEARKNLG